MFPVRVQGVGLGRAPSKPGRLEAQPRRDADLGLKGFLPTPALGPCPQPLSGPRWQGHPRSWGRGDSSSGGRPQSSTADGSLSPSPGVRVQSWVGRTLGWADPAHRCPWGCHGGCYGHPGRQGEAGDTSLENWGTDSRLDLTTTEAALKFDAWLLGPAGERAWLLPATPAAHHLPGRWASGWPGGRPSSPQQIRWPPPEPPGLPACPPGWLLCTPWPTCDPLQPREPSAACCRLLPGEKLPGTPAPEAGSCSFPVL